MCRWWDMPWLGRTAVQWQCSSWQGWPMDWHCGQGAGKLSVSKNACGKYGASPLLPGKHFSLYKPIHPKLFVRLVMEEWKTTPREKWRCLEKWARSPDHPQGLQAVYATIFDVQQHAVLVTWSTKCRFLKLNKRPYEQKLCGSQSTPPKSEANLQNQTKKKKQTSSKSFLVFGFIWFHSIRSRLLYKRNQPVGHE